MSAGNRNGSSIVSVQSQNPYRGTHFTHILLAYSRFLSGYVLNIRIADKKFKVSNFKLKEP